MVRTDDIVGYWVQWVPLFMLQLWFASATLAQEQHRKMRVRPSPSNMCVMRVFRRRVRMLSSITDRWPQTHATAPRITRTDNATQTAALCLETIESVIHINRRMEYTFFIQFSLNSILWLWIMTLRCDYFIFKFSSLISLRFPRSSFCFLLGSDPFVCPPWIVVIM